MYDNSHLLSSRRFAGAANRDVTDTDNAARQLGLFENTRFIKAEFQANACFVDYGENAQDAKHKPVNECIVMTVRQLEQVLRHGVITAHVRTAFFVDITGIDFVMSINTAFSSCKSQQFHQIFNAADGSTAIFFDNLQRCLAHFFPELIVADNFQDFTCQFFFIFYLAAGTTLF